MKGRYGNAYAHKRQKRNTTKKSKKKAIVASDGNRQSKRIQDKNDLEVATTNSNTTTKSTRNTDTIFYGTKVTDITKEEMIAAWEKGWKCLFDAIIPLKDEDLERIIYIRNQGQSVTDAINRQLAHYSYHVGQIVYIGTLIKDNSWQSLSIPKNQSNTFNKKKFSEGKHLGHFTDDFK